MAITDTIYGSTKMLSVVITLFVAFFVWVSFSTLFTSHLVPNINNTINQNAVNSTIQNVTVGLTTIDYIIPFILMGMLLVSLIFAYKTGASVVYAVLSVVIWILALIMSAVFTNVFLEVNNTFDYSSTFQISYFLMNNMKYIVLGWLALITIVMFTRNKQENDAIAAAETVWT